VTQGPGGAWVRPTARLSAAVWRALWPQARISSSPGLVAADSGDPNWLFNWAVVLDRFEPGESAAVAARLKSAFPTSAAVHSIWDGWQTLVLSPHGYQAYPMPEMVRAPGGVARPRPAELVSERVTDRPALLAFGSIVSSGFDAPGTDASPLAGRFQAAAIDDPRLRIWVGRVDGAAVACSLAYVGPRAVYVDFVATALDHRRRGYGEALTWAAVLEASDRPAVLHASEEGRSTYERMGFRAVGETSLWFVEPVGAVGSAG
jgi:GNAT superfamily N-acetyltransferase